jgi:hypothetical protein
VADLKVSFKLVADVRKPGEGVSRAGTPAPLVAKSERTKPRVDIKTEVETYDAKPGRTDGARVSGVNGKVNVGAGGGVLGHLLATKSEKADVPDPKKLNASELRALLAPYVGQEVVVTNHDKDTTLAVAAKKGDVADARGILVGVDDEGSIQLKKDGRVNEVSSEYWAFARIRVDGGPVIAQDPAYPRHYSE